MYSEDRMCIWWSFNLKIGFFSSSLSKLSSKLPARPKIFCHFLLFPLYFETLVVDLCSKSTWRSRNFESLTLRRRLFLFFFLSLFFFFFFSEIEVDGGCVETGIEAGLVGKVTEELRATSDTNRTLTAENFQNSRVELLTFLVVCLLEFWLANYFCPQVALFKSLENIPYEQR